MRTIVEVTPVTHRVPLDSDGSRYVDAPIFEFAGYKIPATDTKLQAIAHVENKTDTSVSAKLTPTLSGKIAGSAEANTSIDDSKTGTADIGQQYNNLNIDVTPHRLRVVRESERGLDLEGNTIITPISVKLPPKSLGGFVMLATPKDSFFEKQKPKPRKSIALAPKYLNLPLFGVLQVNVRLVYTLRLPTAGTRKYYVEGSQDVDTLSDVVTKTPQQLVDISDVLPDLYQIQSRSSNATLMLSTHGHQSELVFSDYITAVEFASWVTAVGEGSVGQDGYQVTTSGRAKPREAFYAVRRYNSSLAQSDAAK
jgi:hypothetical protein